MDIPTTEETYMAGMHSSKRTGEVVRQDPLATEITKHMNAIRQRANQIAGWVVITREVSGSPNADTLHKLIVDVETSCLELSERVELTSNDLRELMDVMRLVRTLAQ